MRTKRTHGLKLAVPTEPMTQREAQEWLEQKPDRWRQFLDEKIESDVTASDLVEEIR